MKSAFSLLELIFVIVVLGIIASFAIPKFIDTKDSALASTIKRDVNTAINAIQSFYLLNGEIEKITDAVTINDSNWVISDTKLTDKNSCLSLEIITSSIDTKSIKITVDTSINSKICKKIQEIGIFTVSYDLY